MLSLCRFLLFPLIVLSAVPAFASFDFFCSPTWTISGQRYDRCSQLPVLSPSNDRRVNLKLLLVDGGFARLQDRPVTSEDADLGYGKVPFRVENFEGVLFGGRRQETGRVQEHKDSRPVANVDEDGSREDEDFQAARNVYQSRCMSNGSGMAAFIEAVGKEPKIPAGERQLLVAARKRLDPVCADAPDPKAPAAAADLLDPKKIKSETGAEFALYLRGAGSFYGGLYEEASFVFATLAQSDDPWLKEASRYMLGRAELNRAQKKAFDEYGFPDLKKVDQAAMVGAEKNVRAYLKSYPAGSYASSARGLLRRIYWMSDRAQELADECEWQLRHPDSPQHNLSLDEFALEVDGKLLDMGGAADLKNPLFLAVLDLALMRVDSPSEPARITLAELQKQRPNFAGREDLYEFLLAAHYFHVQKNPAKALEHLPASIPKEITYLDFSRLVLRGLALEANKDLPAARKLWLDLLPAVRKPLQAETVQLALAINFQEGRAVELAFRPPSPINETALRNVLIENDASAKLLREIAGGTANTKPERDLALYTLLYKDLFQSHYRDFVEDHKLIQRGKPGSAAPQPDDSPLRKSLAQFDWSGTKSDDSFDCPSIVEVGKALAKDPNDPLGLLCLGDFVKSEFPGLNSREVEPAESKAAAAGQAVLGAGPSDFAGRPFSRGEGYKKVVADEHAAADMRAYGLYRLVRCYAPSGNNDCGGKDVAEPVRRSWFKTLKSKYPDSPWARRLKYYW